MPTNSPSSQDSVDIAKRRQALKALLSMVASDRGTHSKVPTGLSLLAVPDRMNRSTMSMPFPSVTAYAIVRRGVPGRSLIALGEYLGIGKGDVADLVDMNRATAYRKVASNEPLPLHAAESVLRLLEIQWLADDTFETMNAASAWLRRGHPMLAGDTPLVCAKSAYGSERVKELLIALKYGGAA